MTSVGSFCFFFLNCNNLSYNTDVLSVVSVVENKHGTSAHMARYLQIFTRYLQAWCMPIEALPFQRRCHCPLQAFELDLLWSAFSLPSFIRFWPMEDRIQIYKGVSKQKKHGLRGVDIVNVFLLLLTKYSIKWITFSLLDIIYSV